MLGVAWVNVCLWDWGWRRCLLEEEKMEEGGGVWLKRTSSCSLQMMLIFSTYSLCFCICLSLSVSLCVCLCLCVCLFHPQDPKSKNGRYGGPQAFWINTPPLSYTLNEILKKKRGDNICLDQRKLFKEEVGFELKFWCREPLGRLCRTLTFGATATVRKSHASNMDKSKSCSRSWSQLTCRELSQFPYTGSCCLFRM